MRVLFYTNIPTPYRLDFFNLLGQSFDLTVVFTQHRSNSVGWAQGNEDIRNFKAVFLSDTIISPTTVYNTGKQADGLHTSENKLKRI